MCCLFRELLEVLKCCDVFYLELIWNLFYSVTPCFQDDWLQLQTGLKAIQPLFLESRCTQLTVHMFLKVFGTMYNIHMKVTI